MWQMIGGRSVEQDLVAEKPYEHVAAAAAGVKLQLKKRWKNLIQ